MKDDRQIYHGDCLEILKTLPSESVNCCITSPPYYGLRDYGNEKQIGLEDTPDDYIDKLVCVFREIKRILRPDGTLWLNIGDSYWGSGSRGYDFTGKMTEASKVQEGSKGTINLSNLPKLVGNRDRYKNKDLIGIPWMLAFALRKDGWYLRQDIIWHKPNPMPESVKDRCTKAHEYIFLLSKSPNYYFDYEQIQEDATYKSDKRNGQGRIAYDGKRVDGEDDKAQQSFVTITDKRNKRDVWSVSPSHIKEAHFATYPEELVEPCILAGCPRDGVVIDPFLGSGTTGRVAERLGRKWIGIELNEEYVEIAKERTNEIQSTLF